MRCGHRPGNISGVMLRSFCLLVLAAAPFAASAQSVERSLTVGGRHRTYRLYVPESAKGKPAPLVLAFHGGGGRGNNMEKLSRLSALAQREGFIVAYPDAYEGNWNDGRSDFDATAFREHIDDVAFVRSILVDVARISPVDPRRVFATGISNGGIFSHYLGAKLSDRIAAIAPVVGGIAVPFDREFAPAQPVSVFAMNGTKDPLVPFAGGNVAKTGRGKVIAADESMRLWVERDSTVRSPETGVLPDRDPADGCRVTWKKWTGGSGGTEVWLYVEEGAGHTWPGGAQYMPRLLVGAVCRDFDATETIWAFFRSHPKP
ncbi:MAG: alpha/beta hydrolase family esterase [Gemmatimonadales bacterium]